MIIHSVLLQPDFSGGGGGFGRDETTGLLPPADPVADVPTQRFPKLQIFFANNYWRNKKLVVSLFDLWSVKISLIFRVFPNIKTSQGTT